MTRSPPRPRAYAPDPDAPGRSCDMPDCPHAGHYRAPKSRAELTSYFWFCLEHVRAYNAKWDFYKGMTPGQIESELRADASWHRPSWPMGQLGARIDEAVLRDPNHVLNAGLGGRRYASPPGTPSMSDMPRDLRDPMATMGLDWPVSMEVLKARYKELAKLHHPDANGGDRSAEERIKTINLAYAAIRGRIAEPHEAAG
jgi:hypothetical protein